MPASAFIEALRANMRRALRERSKRDVEEILAQLKREDPLSAETRGFEVELYLLAGRLGDAHALAEQLCRLFPLSARIAYLAGLTAYRIRRYDEAEAHLRESNRIHPHWWTQRWLGKTLTQLGQFDEAEALLLSVRERTPGAWLDLAWLCERRGDLEEALVACDRYLALRPGDAYATDQRVRLKASLLEPESIIEEANALEALGEDMSDALFPEYVKGLFATGKTREARSRVLARIGRLDAKTGSKLAWICYHARAFDLACTLFLAYLPDNLGYYKYLNSLEAAAKRCGRVPQVLEKYAELSATAPSLHGRAKVLRLGR
jgi:tetratricopeptide (TPR) repeat protein